ncbi:hypothetical protein TGMAS_215165 [Toxoplasma gondii MAS]|uniref:Uncharacterized protein n=3 Tax=Toxoplasma gondii TaxID=5811 RepID=V5B646_TOXGV|nr:hypothetical protein TGVEG_215165 [Toxoplasma gondii VEG]KFH16478.1 hypothetical protein TGMAS_215165 [Toxoplasma gondii MAS]RQX69928.1 hypothetical protein TGCAST_215165 [Toxoplasma gondii CAST]
MWKKTNTMNQSGGWTLCANSKGDIGYISSFVVPHGFQNSSGFLQAYVRTVALLKEDYSGSRFSGKAGDAVVILVTGKKWSLVRALQNPYRYGHVSTRVLRLRKT